MWEETLSSFEKSASSAFRFLVEERGFEDPVVEFARDYFLVYVRSEDALKVSVGLERDWLVPFISVEIPGEEQLYAYLPRVVTKLGLNIDTSGFARCHEIEEASYPTPGVKGLRLHKRYRDHLEEEWTPYLTEYGRVLRLDFERIIECGEPLQVTGGQDGLPRLLGVGLGCLLPIVLVALFVIRHCA